MDLSGVPVGIRAECHDIAVIGLDPVEIIAGDLPRRQRRLVEAWAELHQEELLAGWQRLREGNLPLPIAPLE